MCDFLIQVANITCSCYFRNFNHICIKRSTCMLSSLPACLLQILPSVHQIHSALWLSATSGIWGKLFRKYLWFRPYIFDRIRLEYYWRANAIEPTSIRQSYLFCFPCLSIWALRHIQPRVSTLMEGIIITHEYHNIEAGRRWMAWRGSDMFLIRKPTRHGICI